MPRALNQKSSHGYAKKLKGGLEYAEIADKMTMNGDKMNHSTARHTLTHALTKMAKAVCAAVGATPTAAELDRISRDPRFQESICDFLNESHNERERNG